MHASANPYVGPRAFGEEDGRSFFGRDREIREIRALAVSRRAVLLYAPSGAGKTSLLQAGLLPALREIPGTVCFPVARVGGEPPGRLPVANLYVFNLLTLLAGERTELAGLASLSLREGLAQAVAALRGTFDSQEAPEVFVLTIDQAEEIFSFAPHRFAERQGFFRQLREALDALPEITLLLALREDWLAHLDPWLDHFPDRLRTRVRLELLGRDAALRAVTEPARREGVAFAPAAAEGLVDDLRRQRVQGEDGRQEDVHGPHVDPVQLQVVCRRLWDRRPAGASEIDLAQVEALGSVDRALADYYAAAVAEAAARGGLPEQAVRRWCGHRLITAGGLRGLVPCESGSPHGLDDGAVQALIAAHLVRAERRRGAVWLELAHDRLIEPVLRDNEAWEEAHLSTLERAADAWERAGRPAGGFLTGDLLIQAERWAAAHAAEISPEGRDFLAASRRERNHRRARRLAGVTSFLLVLALAFTLSALREQRSAHRQALVQGLVAQARLSQRDDLDLALLLAVESGRLTDSATRSLASQALFEGLNAGSSLVTLLHNSANVLGLAVHPEGHLLAAALDDGTVRLWDLATQRPAGPPLPVSSGRAWSVSWSPDGHRLAAAGDQALLLWSGRPGASAPRRLAIGPAEELDAYAVAWSPEGRTLAAATSANDVRRWDVATGEPVDPPLRGPTDWVTSLAWSPDGNLLAAGSMDHQTYLWDLRTGRLLRPPAGRHAEGIYSVAVHPDGHLLASAGHDGTVILQETATGRLQGWPLHTADGLATAVAWSHDGRRLAFASQRGTIDLWDAEARRPASPPRTLAQGSLRALAFTPDGRTLTAGHGAAIALWAVEPAVPLGHRSLLSPAALEHWRRRSGADRRAAPSLPPCVPQDRILARAWSADGRRLATAHRDHRIFLWTAETGELLAGPFTGHAEEIVGLAFAADGRTLDSADREGTLIRWDVDLASWRRRACRMAHRSLTREEWQMFLPGEPYAPTCRPD